MLNENGLGLLFTLVAPAGAGKNSLMNIALERSTALRQLPTATTRALRPGEQQGREHLFIDREDFQHMIRTDALLEWQEVHGRLYGVPRQTVEDAIMQETDMIADIEYKGAKIIHDQYPDNVIQIFIRPPSIPTLIDRMRVRGESEAEISRRLLRFQEELDYAQHCEYVITNDDIEVAAQELLAIISAERSHREIRRLRQRYAIGQEPYCFEAVVLILNGQTLVSNETTSHLPSAAIQSGEPSAQAAMRAVSEALGQPADAERLETAAAMDDKFVPPLAIETMQQNNQEYARLIYKYHLDENSPLAAGWRWQHVDSTPLSANLHRIVAEHTPTAGTDLS